MQRTFKGIRNDLGLTQQQMADKLGISWTSYRKKESYQVSMCADEFIRFCQISNTNPFDIKLKI